MTPKNKPLRKYEILYSSDEKERKEYAYGHSVVVNEAGHCFVVDERGSVTYHAHTEHFIRIREIKARKRKVKLSSVVKDESI